MGRYGAAGLSDLSIHADGTLDLIRNYQGLGTLEWHGKKLDVYSYAGVEYAGRAYDFDPLLNAGQEATSATERRSSAIRAAITKWLPL